MNLFVFATLAIEIVLAQSSSPDCQILNNWLYQVNATDCCEQRNFGPQTAERFSFIRCRENNRVYELNLDRTGLSVEISPELSQLTELTRVFLNNNTIYGSIPTSIAELTKLESFDVSFNQLSGELPTEIGQLSSMQELSLFGNKFSGTVPKSISKMTNLTRLGLHDNRFEGEIPAEILSLPQLDWFKIHNNQFSGPLPVIPQSIRFCDIRNAGPDLCKLPETTIAESCLVDYQLKECLVDGASVPTGQQSGLSRGAIAGIVIAVLVSACLIIGAFVYFTKTQRPHSLKTLSNNTNNSTPPSMGVPLPEPYSAASQNDDVEIPINSVTNSSPQGDQKIIPMNGASSSDAIYPIEDSQKGTAVAVADGNAQSSGVFLSLTRLAPPPSYDELGFQDPFD